MVKHIGTTKRLAIYSMAPVLAKDLGKVKRTRRTRQQEDMLNGFMKAVQIVRRTVFACTSCRPYFSDLNARLVKNLEFDCRLRCPCACVVHSLTRNVSLGDICLLNCCLVPRRVSALPFEACQQIPPACLVQAPHYLSEKDVHPHHTGRSQMAKATHFLTRKRWEKYWLAK